MGDINSILVCRTLFQGVPLAGATDYNASMMCFLFKLTISDFKILFKLNKTMLKHERLANKKM